MNPFVRSVVSLLLVASIFGLTMPLPPQTVNALEHQSGSEKAKVKTGPEVAARVKKLKDNNQSVRAALRVFEKKGHKPRIEDSWLVTDKLSAHETALLQEYKKRNRRMLQKARFPLQQETVSDAQGEITFIPTVSLDGEWQGTIIITAYDEYGNFVRQYTANVVLVRDPGAQEWIAVYEVGFEGGVPYLNWEPGMYTGFDLGTPLNSQEPPPTQLLDWQQYDPSFNPSRGTGEGGGPSPALEQPMARLSKISFTRNSFSRPQAGDRGGDYRYRNGRCPCDPPPAVRRWASCTAAGCSGAAVSCGIAGPFTAACFSSRCAGVVVACAVGGLFGG
jgi:hypothetical protein